MTIDSKDLIRGCQLIQKWLESSTNFIPEYAELTSLKEKYQKSSLTEFKKWLGDQAMEYIVAMAVASEQPTIINVPRSHYDDFNRHRGWWALFDDVNLEPGQLIRFNLDGFEPIDARVNWFGRNPTKYPNFSNWWIVEYQTLTKKAGE